MNFATEIDASARDAPESLAVADPTRELTYGEFAEETAAVASVFEDLGVTAGDRVVLYLPNGVPFVTVYFGAMKRGIVPVPVSFQFELHEINTLLKNIGATAVVTDERIEAATATLEASTLEHTIVVNGDQGLAYEDLIANADRQYDPVARKEYELAELIYTRGITGEPKPVMHTHGNLSANARAVVRYWEWSRHEVGLTLCPCFHVFGLHTTTTPLAAAGAENHFPGEWNESVLERMNARNVTVTFMTSLMLNDVLEHGTENYDLSALKQVGVIGALSHERVTTVETDLGCELLRTYGTTETMPLAAVARPGDSVRPLGTVGEPASEVVKVRVEDPRDGTHLSEGKTGELLWRGDTVMSGYWNMPEANDEAFVKRNGEFWLRSNDLGQLKNGRLLVEGRLRDAIVTDESLVFSIDVEDALYQLEGILEAAVVGSADGDSGDEITALIMRATDALTAKDVKAHCRDALKAYEVPDTIEFVEQLPAPALRAMNSRSLDQGDWFKRGGEGKRGPGRWSSSRLDQ
jgi:long-chain acyl-CoA synthetase